MNKKIISTFCFIFLLGCNGGEKASQESASVKEPEYLQALAWVKTSDARKDAEESIARKDYRLFVFAGRGENMPGIDPAQKELLLKQCGKQYLPGSTDAIRDKVHQQRLKQAYNYAVAYNQQLLKHCQ